MTANDFASVPDVTNIALKKKQAVTGCLVWALDRTTFRYTILESGQERRKKNEEFLSKVRT